MLLLWATLSLCQEAAASAQPPVPQDGNLQMMDIRIQMIGFKDDFELPAAVDDADSFMKDTKTTQSMVWSRDFRMSTVVGRELTMTVGENVPIVTGVSVSPAGRLPQLTYQPTGTTVHVKSSLDSKGRIFLNLNLVNARIDRDSDDNSDLEKEMLKTTLRNLTYSSEIVVSSNETKAISYSKSSSDPNVGSETALFLIIAKILPD